MKHEHLSLKELIHYAEIGEVPGLHPTVAKRIRELMSVGQDLDEGEPTRQELKDEIASLEETIDEIHKMSG